MMRLGEIANAWAGIEEQLCLAFCHLSGTDYETATIIFYTPSSFRGRLEIVRNLTRHSMPEAKEKQAFLRALEKLNGLNTTRNALVHARYGYLVGNRPNGENYGWVIRKNTAPNKAEMRAEGRAS